MNVVQLPKSSEQSGVNVIEQLEKLMKLAKEGQVLNFFVVGILRDKAVLSGWANREHPFAMLGGIENAKLEFMRSAVDQA